MSAPRRRVPTKTATKSLPTAGGVGKSGSRFAWSALASDSEESDSETESVPVVVRLDSKSALQAFLESPDIVAMKSGEILWGDLLCAADPVPVLPPSATTPPPASVPLRGSEDEFWSQPFTARLEEMWADTYNTAVLSDSEYNDLMSWLFAKGWEVVDFDREGVKFYPGCQTPRRWDPATGAPEEVRKVRFEEPASCCDHSHPHSHSHTPARRTKAPKSTVTVPRFCREGAGCTAAGCRYVHGNTIPRINEPCAFGAGCGASDPTGVKRSQCLRMHPGEVWTPDLVITRL